MYLCCSASGGAIITLCTCGFFYRSILQQNREISLFLKGGWNVEYVGRAILRVISMNVSMSALQRLFRINESVNGKSIDLELLLLLINVYFVLVKINKIEATKLLRLLRRFFNVFRLSHVNPNVWRYM